jgi:hypothetical protein
MASHVYWIRQYAKECQKIKSDVITQAAVKLNAKL